MKSLKSKVSLLAICLLSVTMIVAAAFGVSAISNIGNSAADRVLNLLCETGQKNLNAYFESVEQSVKMTSAFVESDLRALGVKELHNHLNRTRDILKKMIPQTNGVVTYYYRIDPSVSTKEKGFWYVNLDGKGFVEHEVTDITKYSLTDTSQLVWFTVPRKTGKAVWLPPYITDNLDLRVISYNIPVYYHHLFVGVIGIEIDYSTMAEEVNSITLFNNGYAFINDDEGNIIYHPHMDVTKLSGNHPTIPDGLISENSITKYTYEGITKKAVWKRLSNGMRLNVAVPVSEIDALWMDWVLKLIIVFVILLVLAFVLTAVLTRHITRPLRELTDAARRVNEGDYDFELTYHGKDEIGVLTNTFRDLTSHLKNYISDLNDLAYADALTSLHNKGAFDKYLQEIEDHAKEAGTAPEYAVCIFDCNNLKKINDCYGHDKGNIYLQESAHIICEVYDHSPVFRIGGDEFAAVLLKTDYQNRETLLKQFDELCGEKTAQADCAWKKVDIARGMAVYDAAENENIHDVVRRADKLMYEHKWMHKRGGA